MDSSSASGPSPNMLEESPHNDVQEEALSSKEIIDQSQSNEGVGNQESSFSKSVRATGSSKNPHPTPPMDKEEEREYSCKYCNQKFSNKQALGGHQNAHKLERIIEKKIQDWQMANSRYLPRNSIIGSLFNRSQKFFSRAMMNMPYFARQGTMQHGMMRYARASRFLTRINEGHPRWPRSMPGNVTQFTARPRSSCLENQPTSILFSTPRPVPNRNILGESSNVLTNGRETQVVEDDSGLDLTLRL
ncbi:uncharacterized protein LOC111399925 [Olea europaea var. sylvestris]|uniref:uncharacterized protein LOC111399925 n=1 Tax=Olea europaea var. sylvestris TaxID=158386 RepID=UPI000C1D633C|nr:uncharacterized protein LOC111399925 [Olea europaea var. sylvestris]